MRGIAVAMDIDMGKLRFGFLATILAVLLSYYGQPLIHGNSEAINVIVTVFSVLAGFLVAIITIVGDPVLLPPGTWRAAEMDREKLTRRLVRHRWLFTLYLITLALIFLSLLLQKQYPRMTVWFERGHLFFGILSFILSMKLPGSLMRIQKERIEAVIEHRRACDKVR